MAKRREDEEDRLSLDYPTFEDAVRAVGTPQLQEPALPEGVTVEPYDGDRYHVVLSDGKTWDVEVSGDGAGYRWRLEEGQESEHAYASREFALGAAVRRILKG